MEGGGRGGGGADSLGGGNRHLRSAAARHRFGSSPRRDPHLQPIGAIKVERYVICRGGQAVSGLKGGTTGQRVPTVQTVIQHEHNP
jgi:hypothetical protein